MRLASPIRVALIDDDSGLVTVLDRRFQALGWGREVLGYPAGRDELARCGFTPSSSTPR